jgi:VWFA-related protein
MSGLALAVLLVVQPAPAVAPGTEIRALTVSFLDEQGGAVADLTPSDVALSENGVAREITSFKPDRRPLSVALIVDSSAAAGSAYRLNVVDAVTGLVARLPDGTRYALWTSGERPSKLVDYTEDRETAGKALRRVAPQGGNYMLDALSEASTDLKKLAREGDRGAVVAISFTGPEFSYRDKFRSVEEARKSAALFLAVEIESSDADFETRSNLSYTLDHLAVESGGRYEAILSPMGVDGALRKASAALRAGYRVAYATVPDLKKRKLEISVARPKTKVVLPVGSTAQAPRS